LLHGRVSSQKKKKIGRQKQQYASKHTVPPCQVQLQDRFEYKWTVVVGRNGTISDQYELVFHTVGVIAVATAARPDLRLLLPGVDGAVVGDDMLDADEGESTMLEPKVLVVEHTFDACRGHWDVVLPAHGKRACASGTCSV
jgi:hypothetical protein